MKKPNVIRVDRSVASTAFAVGDGCACTPIVQGNGLLYLRRAGTHGEEICIASHEIDEEGRFAFAWDGRVRCLPPGLYSARLQVNCADVGRFIVQFGEHKAIQSAENMESSGDCHDGLCMSCGCHYQGDSCGCRPVPVIYIPPYHIQRGR